MAMQHFGLEWPTLKIGLLGMISGSKVYTALFGKLVGADEFGNRYYEGRFDRANNRMRRWVMFKGMAEGSKVPPEWHSWLHHTTAEPIKARTLPWQKKHVVNTSGTPFAFLPPGHDQRGGQRDAATGDYEAWQG